VRLIDNNRVFKYSIIKNEILTDIQDRKFLPGDKIYSENELKEMHDVSSTTVVKALNELVSEGYLVRRQGEGTFVRRNVVHRQVLYSEDMLIDDHLMENSETIYTTVSETFSSEDISEKFESVDEDIILVTQMGVIDNDVWKIQNRFYLETQLDETARQNIRNNSSVSSELGYDENVINFPTSTRISSGRFDNALEVIKNNFDSFEIDCNIDFQKPLLILKRLIRDRNNNPIEYDINYIDSDVLEINIETT